MFLPLSLFYHSANQKEHTSTNPAASPPARQYVLDDKPAQSLYVNRTARALPDVSAIITVLSDAIHSAVDGSVIDALKGGIDKLHSSAHIGEGRRFHNASFSHSHGDIGVRMGACPFLIRAHQRERLTLPAGRNPMSTRMKSLVSLINNKLIISHECV